MPSPFDKPSGDAPPRAVSPTVGTRNEEFKLLKTLKKRLTKDGGSFVAMARLFKKMDLDGNGVVDLEEFEHAIETMDMMLSKEKVRCCSTTLTRTEVGPSM